jgi:hypothetical protein
MYTHEKPHSLEKSTTYTDAQDSKHKNQFIVVVYLMTLSLIQTV